MQSVKSVAARVKMELVADPLGAEEYLATLSARKEVWAALVMREPEALKVLSPDLRADPEVVLSAVGKDALALEYAAPSLLADRDFVLSAIHRSSGLALRHAAENVRADREVVLVATKSYCHAFQYAAASLRSDFDTVAKATKMRTTAASYAGRTLRTNRDFQRKVIELHSRCNVLTESAVSFCSTSSELLIHSPSESVARNARLVQRMLRRLLSFTPPEMLNCIRVFLDGGSEEASSHLLEEARGPKFRRRRASTYNFVGSLDMSLEPALQAV
jgi:hypothetical protein